MPHAVKQDQDLSSSIPFLLSDGDGRPIARFCRSDDARRVAALLDQVEAGELAVKARDMPDLEYTPGYAPQT